MNRRIADDEEDDWEEEGESYGEDDEEDSIPCPYCGRDVYDGAVRCPHCENYLSAEDRPAERKPGWILLGFALCFAVIFLWMMMSL